MGVELVEGDLFAQRDVDALGHGVNCEGRMGAGVAVEFRRRFPDMFAQYTDVCRTGQLRVGGLFPYQLGNGRWVYNLATQDRRGRDARLDAVASSVAAALDHAVEHQVSSIAIPRIGAGIGGLSWPAVHETLREVADRSPVMLRVVTLPPTRRGGHRR